MRIVSIDEVSFEEITEVIRNGGLVVYPTDTCYGLGCDPTNNSAVEKLLRYKSRREGKAISIAVDSEEMASQYVEINFTAKQIFNRFLPGPYTVICKSKGVVVKGIEAEDETLGIRVPDNEWLLNLVNAYKKPITATSANQYYKKIPYSVQDILSHSSKSSVGLIDLCIDAGTLPYKAPSTVLNITLGDVQILRKGEFLPEGAKVEEFISESAENTLEFAQNLFHKFKVNLEFRPLIFALQGDLGAGKTQFTKGVAKAMGIAQPITSPTFILSNEFISPKGNKLYHIDTWRLENDGQFEELGIKEMLGNKNNERQKNDALHSSSFNLFNVLSVEWADKVIDYLRMLDMNNKVIWVEIGFDKGDGNKRVIKWSE